MSGMDTGMNIDMSTEMNMNTEMKHDKLLLASGSPRRLDILRAAGIDPEVSPVDAEELKEGLTPKELVRQNALLKAGAAAALHPGRVILAADTLVALGPLPLGKPLDEDDACRMLTMLSGRTHSVFTGVAVWVNGELLSDVAESRVTFRELTGAEIAEYVASGEPLDKAGAYAVQGIGAALVSGIEGDFDNIVGLPMAVVKRLLEGWL